MALCFPYDILQLEFYRENLRPLPKSYFWSMASARVTAFEAIWRVMANFWRTTVEEGILAVWNNSFWRTDLKLLLKTFLGCRPVTRCSSGKWRFIRDHGQKTMHKSELVDLPHFDRDFWRLEFGMNPEFQSASSHSTSIITQTHLWMSCRWGVSSHKDTR